MRKTELRHGKVCYWALVFSIAAHSVTLGVFTGVKLAAVRGEKDSPQPILTLQTIARVMDSTAPMPKPRVEPVADPPTPPEPKQPPLVDAPPTETDRRPAEESPPQTAEAAAPAPPDTVEFFGQKSIVRRVCYVVDCSGSMYGRMYRVKDQLKQSILDLNSRQTFSVLFFMDGQNITTTGRGLTPATAAAKSTALRQIAAVRPCGSTDAAYALRAAMQLRDDAGKGPEVIYFLTDGFELDAARSQRFLAAIDRLRKTCAPDAVLHTIGFGVAPLARRTLDRLAQSTGGTFIEID